MDWGHEGPEAEVGWSALRELAFWDVVSLDPAPSARRELPMMPNGLELSGPAKLPSYEIAELAGSAPASG